MDRAWLHSNFHVEIFLQSDRFPILWVWGAMATVIIMVVGMEMVIEMGMGMNGNYMKEEEGFPQTLNTPGVWAVGLLFQRAERNAVGGGGVFLTATAGGITASF